MTESKCKTPDKYREHVIEVVGYIHTWVIQRSNGIGPSGMPSGGPVVAVLCYTSWGAGQTDLEKYNNPDYVVGYQMVPLRSGSEVVGKGS